MVDEYFEIEASIFLQLINRPSQYPSNSSETWIVDFFVAREEDW